MGMASLLIEGNQVFSFNCSSRGNDFFEPDHLHLANGEHLGPSGVWR